MSTNSFITDLNHAARKARGKQSFATYAARNGSLKGFANHMWKKGDQIHKVGQIKEKHIRSWVEELKKRGLKTHSIQNNMCHIRTALEGIGRRPFADRLTNAKLGIGGASRRGVREPMPWKKYVEFLSLVSQIDEGVAIALELQYNFGLRMLEAIRSNKSLYEWMRELTNPRSDGWITIVYGAKGGKTRRAPPLNQEAATELVQRAIDCMKRRGGRLIDKPTLKQAKNRYRYVLTKVGMIGAYTSHTLRYSYACQMLICKKVEGMKTNAAAALVSTQLGHGDGRGTWVKSTYCQSVFQNEADLNGMLPIWDALSKAQRQKLKSLMESMAHAKV